MARIQDIHNTGITEIYNAETAEVEYVLPVSYSLPLVRYLSAQGRDECKSSRPIKVSS